MTAQRERKTETRHSVRDRQTVKYEQTDRLIGTDRVTERERNSKLDNYLYRTVFSIIFVHKFCI